MLIGKFKIYFTRDSEKITGQSYDTNNHKIILYKNLPNKEKQKIEKLLKKESLKHKFPTTLILKITNKKIKVIHSKPAKINIYELPEILLNLLEIELINEKELIRKIPTYSIKFWYQNTLPKNHSGRKVFEGRTNFEGIDTGELLNDRKKIQKAIKEKKKFIWLIEKVSAEDLQLFHHAKGLILLNSSSTSHAAIMGKGLGLPSLILKNPKIKNYTNKKITIDSYSGIIYDRELKIKFNENQIEAINTILSIAKKYSKINILGNSSNPKTSQECKLRKGEGIGLCRTEHMFIGAKRANYLRSIILQKDKPIETIQKLKDLLIKDFYNIFKYQNQKKIVIRYLDAPMHEILPHRNSEIKALSKILKISVTKLKRKITKLQEKNPMLGLRGVRMLLFKPSLIKLQTEAIIESLAELKKDGIEPSEINLEFPMISSVKEIEYIKNTIEKYLPKGNFKIGIMIETPRAALQIKEILPKIDFLSFGTNDLTQMTYGISRDDSTKIIQILKEKQIIDFDPFQKLDEKGVGILLKKVVKEVRSTKPEIKISICGEQATNYDSIRFINKIGIDEISCNPQSIPTVIISNAKLNLKNPNKIETFSNLYKSLMQTLNYKDPAKTELSHNLKSLHE